MPSSRKKTKAPENLYWVDNEPGLTPEEIERKRAEGVRLVKEMFEAHPETRLSVADFFRKKFADSKDSISPEMRRVIEEYLKDVEGEYYALMLGTFADKTREEIAAWEKETNPPGRKIMRREKELKESMEMIAEIPARYQKGARKDFEMLLARLQKLQE